MQTKDLIRYAKIAALGLAFLSVAAEIEADSGKPITQADVQELLKNGESDQLKAIIEERRIDFMRVLTPLASWHTDSSKSLLDTLRQHAGNNFEKLMYLHACVRYGRVDQLDGVAKFQTDGDEKVRNTAIDASRILEDMKRFFKERFGMLE